jgi:hypothetical protein
MARNSLAFKQTDLMRALKAFRAAEVPVAKIEVHKDGKIIVIPGAPRKDDPTEANEWDEA